MRQSHDQTFRAIFTDRGKRSWTPIAAVLVALIVTLPLRRGPLTAQSGTASVLTQHNDNSRTGANLNETILNTSNVNVNQFGKLFSRSVDGQVYAQPLYVPGLSIGGVLHNVVYVATMKNNLYAFDADDPSAAAPLWHVNFGAPVPNGDVSGLQDIQGPIGITSTPVIDAASGTLYCVAKTKEGTSQNPTYVQRLHAMDIGTGQDKTGSPVVIDGTVAGSGDDSVAGTIRFNALKHLNRPALLLSNGYIYIAFGSHEDQRPYHGWVFSYDAATLQRVGIYNDTPNGWGGGIWSSGQGLAVDSAGYVYFMTANGSFTMNTGGQDCSSCFVKLGTPFLTVADWFAPYNQYVLNANNFELNTSGPLLLPRTNNILGGGKEGKLYMLDRANMGHFQAGSDGQILQELQVTFGDHLHGSPIYWESPARGPLVYMWYEQNYLDAFKIVNGLIQNNIDPNTGLLVPDTKSTMKVPAGMPGGALSLSANGTAAGSGIVWAAAPYSGDANLNTVAGIARAFDASNLSIELWNSKQNAARDDFGNFAKFTPPTIANGKVYLATFSDQLLVYGLLGGPAPAPAVSSVSPSTGPTTGGSLVTITGTNFALGATVSIGGSAATGVTVVNSTTITATTPAYAAGAVSVTVTNPDTQAGTLPSGFTYRPPAPAVNSVAPSAGPVTGGTAITITGTGFAAGATVSVGGSASTNVTVVNSTTIMAMTAAHAAGAVSVTVTNADAQSGTLASGFTYLGPGPTVTSVSPVSGPTSGGTAITITGTTFAAGATVSVGGSAAASVVVVSATTITAMTPSHAAGTVSVMVTNPDAQAATLANSFTYTASSPPPTVTSVTPTSGPSAGGTGITITGTGFAAGATVSVGGSAATNVTVVNSTTITATTPAHVAGPVNVTVTNLDAQSGTLASGFSYAAPPAGVAFDAVGPAAGGASVLSGSSLSWSHTVTTTGSNLLLTVGVAVGKSPDTGLSLAVTYNGVPMTSAGIVHANNRTDGFVQLFYLKAPATGAHTVQVTLSGGTASIEGGSVSFAGVDQITPVRNIATGAGAGTTPTVSVTSAPGDMVVDAMVTGCTGTMTSSQTLRWLNQVNCATAGGNGAQSTAAGAASVTMGYTVPSDWWGMIGVDVVAASGPAPFDFALTNAGNQSVEQGSVVTNTVTATLSSGTGDAVTFSAAGLPAGVTASFKTPACTPTCSTILTLSADAAAAVGASIITATATDGSLTHTTAFTLTVSAPATPDFTLSATPASQTVVIGASAGYGVTISPTGGFTGNVALSVAGLPTGTTGNFAPNPAPASSSSTLSVTTGATTPVGVYALTVTGTSGTITHTTTVSLTVTTGITVTAPNTAVSWKVASTQNITFTHNLGIGQAVNIDVSRDGGSTWSLITPFTTTSATTATYPWVVTGPVTTRARIRVTAAANPLVSDISDVDFTIVNPTITVTAPNTAVSWRVGDMRNITFSHTLAVGQAVNIDVSRDGGATWSLISTFTTTSATSGTYPWLVSAPVTKQARIRVSWAVDPVVTDMSDVNFTILPRTTVTAPNTAVTWGAGSTRQITWTHNLGLGGLVDIDFSADNGLTWSPFASGVASSAATSGSYTGPMPTTLTTQALIRVVPATDASLGDVSDVAFTLAAPTVTVTAPNNAANWGIGTSQTIKWSHNLGVLESVRIELSRDGGATYTETIAASAVNTANTTGTLPWIVNGPSTTTARMRVTWLANGAITDISNVDFTIR